MVQDFVGRNTMVGHSFVATQHPDDDVGETALGLKGMSHNFTMHRDRIYKCFSGNDALDCPKTKKNLHKLL